MSKRKQDAEEDEEGEEKIVDVNFDYYDVNAYNDHHAIHRLFVQLFGPDAEHVQTGPLTERVMAIAEESGVGSTIKTEEEEGSDPYAVLTVISCRSLQTVTDYLLSKVGEAFRDTLAPLLESGHVGLVLSERLVNMPVQVMGPMYKMLAEEIEDAIADDRAYRFTHYLFVSRAYRPSGEGEGDEDEAARNSKRHKPSSSSPSQPTQSADGLCGFHPEDEEILQHASHSATYAYTESPPPSGLDIAGRVMLVSAVEFGALVRDIADVYRV